MEQAELRDLIPPKQENPLLKRKPLNLGNKFLLLSKPDQTVQFQNVLTEPRLTLLFFGAEWCNISKSFIPDLKSFYQEVNLDGKKIEIIYVGFDKVKKDFENFTKSMPWLGLPFSDQKIQGLKAIPKLILIDNRGEQVKNNCRNDVYVKKEDETEQKWRRLKEAQEKAYFYQEPS